MWKGQLGILIHTPGRCSVHTKTTLLLPLQYKLAMPGDQFIFSSSWLPSQGFKLRTLAGYNNVSEEITNHLIAANSSYFGLKCQFKSLATFQQDKKSCM